MQRDDMRRELSRLHNEMMARLEPLYIANPMLSKGWAIHSVILRGERIDVDGERWDIHDLPDDDRAHRWDLLRQGSKIVTSFEEQISFRLTRLLSVTRGGNDPSVQDTTFPVVEYCAQVLEGLKHVYPGWWYNLTVMLTHKSGAGNTSYYGVVLGGDYGSRAPYFPGHVTTALEGVRAVFDDQKVRPTLPDGSIGANLTSPKVYSPLPGMRYSQVPVKNATPLATLEDGLAVLESYKQQAAWESRVVSAIGDK